MTKETPEVRSDQSDPRKIPERSLCGPRLILEWPQRSSNILLKARVLQFLSDPGIPGVQSMGPGVFLLLEDIVET